MSRMQDRIRLISLLEKDLGGQMSISGNTVSLEYLFGEYSIRVVANENVEMFLRDCELDVEMMAWALAREAMMNMSGWNLSGIPLSHAKYVASHGMAENIVGWVRKVEMLAESLSNEVFRTTEDALCYLLAKMTQTSNAARFLACYKLVTDLSGRYIHTVARGIARARGGEFEQVVQSVSAAKELAR